MGKLSKGEKPKIEQPTGFVKYKQKVTKAGFLKKFGYLLVGVGVSSALAGAGIVFYKTQVQYPSAIKVEEKNTGRYALSVYQKYLNDYATKGLEKTTGSKYLSSEGKLQNGNDARVGFIKSVLSTVKYEPMKTNKLNKYGSDYYVYGSKNKTVKGESLVNFGEAVNVSYIDYSKLNFDARVVNDMITEAGIKQTDKDFVDKITDLFATYISNNVDKLPIKTESRVVTLDKVGKGFKVNSEEDEYLDKLLFSSKDFYDALDRFSLLAQQGSEVESKEHKEWSSKSVEERANYTEPYKWEKYRFIGKSWVGFYNILKENKQDADSYVFPKGGGTLDDPADLNTPILTSVIVKGEDGKDKEIPIKVSLLKVSYGSDAIKDIMKADIRNRGLDPNSSTKYIYTKWRIENLSSESIRVDSNSALADKEGNVSAKTGVMYGLDDYADLKPYQYTELEDWYSSTELTEKYLVWGKDFDKRVPLVWYKALRGTGGKVKVPNDPIETKDISSVKNEEGKEKD